MMDFDHAVADLCAKHGAFYQRYSDDILIICRDEDKGEIATKLGTSLLEQKLEFSVDKTEEVHFDAGEKCIFARRPLGGNGASYAAVLHEPRRSGRQK
jgi:RNA-directed DNA polymerase